MQQTVLSFNRHEKVTFVDWIFIEAGYGYKANVNGPVMVPRGVVLDNFAPDITTEPILVNDKPWEKDILGAYVSIVRDGGNYRLWYEGYPDYHGSSDGQTVLCYAESTDGMHWVKPALHMVEWQGSTDNNIIFKPEMHPNHAGIHGPYVFIDENPACPKSERYKLVHCSNNPRKDARGYCYGGTSADGLTWDINPEPVARTWADSQTIVHWHEGKQQYVGFFRYWDQQRRQIYYGETRDFMHWGRLDPVLVSDPAFPPDHDWYTNGFHPWPGVNDAYFLFPAVYRRARDDLCIVMYASRDLRNWHKLPTNPIIDPGTGSHPLAGGVYMGHGIVDLENGRWGIPVNIPGHRHNEVLDKNASYGRVHLATWRADGFTGIVAKDEGEFWTRPFTYEGLALEINSVARPGGSIKVGIVDALTGQYLPGLSVALCKPVTGDIAWMPVSWEEPVDFSEYDDCTIRLHVMMSRSTFFGFRFA